MLRSLVLALPAALAMEVGEQIGTVTGTPTWTLLLVDYDNGLAVVDRTGKVRWSCPNCGNGMDVLPNGNIATVVMPQKLVEKNGMCVDVAVASTPANGHEARLDRVDTRKVLSITPPRGSGCQHQNVECEGIVHWNRATGESSMAIDLGDHFDPSRDQGALSSKSEWMHTNTVSTGSSQNIVVGIRHLSAVVSFDHSTYEKQWVLSSEITSDFTFGTAADMFFNAHDVTQLDNGNILLHDNGNSRPRGSFSRAAEYTLDFDAKTAKLVWQFQTSFSATGGGARRLSNGNTLVTCSHCAPSSSVKGTVYEVDSSGSEVAKVDFKATTARMFYRSMVVDGVPGFTSTVSV